MLMIALIKPENNLGTLMTRTVTWYIPPQLTYLSSTSQFRRPRAASPTTPKASKTARP